MVIASMLMVLAVIAAGFPDVATIMQQPSGAQRTAPSAQAFLHALIAHLHATAPDPAGSVTYLHYRTWSIDDIVRDRQELATYDHQLWWHRDGIALITRCQRVEPAGTVALTNLAPDTGPCPGTRRLGPGGYRPVVAAPLSTDPAVLRHELTAYDKSSGEQHIVRAVAAAHREHLLDSRQRAAILHVLTQLSTLRFYGKTVDRMGREGVAFGLISGDQADGLVRELLIFDPDTSVLLGYEQIAASSPPGSPIPAETVTAFTVYLDAHLVAAIPA
jgi:hypothetical protein